jgi:hypothetical protein
MDARYDHFPFQDGTFSPLGENAYAPVIPTQAMGFTDDTQWEVVGESRYMTGIQRVKHLMETTTENETLLALLVSEPGNPFDRHAVRIDLVWGYERETCGYFPREQAYRLTPLVRQANDDGLLVFLNATMYGGTAEKPNVGIWLSAVTLNPNARDYLELHDEWEADKRERAELEAREEQATSEYRRLLTEASERSQPSTPEGVPGKKSLWKRLGF